MRYHAEGVAHFATAAPASRVPVVAKNVTSGDTNGAGVPREHPGSLHVTRKAPIPGSRACGAPTYLWQPVEGIEQEGHLRSKTAPP